MEETTEKGPIFQNGYICIDAVRNEQTNKIVEYTVYNETIYDICTLWMWIYATNWAGQDIDK